jgi:hypothetical protein
MPDGADRFRKMAADFSNLAKSASFNFGRRYYERLAKHYLLLVLAAVRIRAKMAKNLTGGRRTGGAAVGCGLSDRKFDCLLPTIGL